YRSSIIRPACPVSISLYLHDALPIYGLEHSIDIAKKYRDAGVDMFHISSGGEAPAGKVKPANHPGYQIPFARAYKEALNVPVIRSEEHTSELQSRENLVCRLLLEKKK